MLSSLFFVFIGISIWTVITIQKKGPHNEEIIGLVQEMWINFLRLIDIFLNLLDKFRNLFSLLKKSDDIYIDDLKSEKKNKEISSGPKLIQIKNKKVTKNVA